MIAAVSRTLGTSRSSCTFSARRLLVRRDLHDRRVSIASLAPPVACRRLLARRSGRCSPSRSPLGSDARRRRLDLRQGRLHGDNDPTWIGIGFIAAEPGLLLLLLALGFAFWWQQSGKPVAGRIVAGLSTLYALLLAIAWLAMSGKWG